MSNTLLDSHLASPKVVDHWHMLSTVALILLQWALLLGVNKHSESLALTKAHSHYRIQFQNFYQKCNFTAWLWVRHWAQSQINMIDLPSKVSFMPGSLCRDCERILKHQVQPQSMFGVWNLSQGNWTWHVITLPGPQWLRISILRVSYSIKDGSSWQISSPSLLSSVCPPPWVIFACMNMQPRSGFPTRLSWNIIVAPTNYNHGHGEQLFCYIIDGLYL